MRAFICTITTGLTCLGSVGHAQEAAPLQGDVTAFETCFIQLLLDNQENPMLGVMGPILCGERNIPMGQTCDAMGYMLFDRREACKQDDLVFWQAQVEIRAAAAIVDGRGGVGITHDSGIAGCDEVSADGGDPLDCLIEINWRTTMEFMAVDLVAELVGDTQ